jgi:hypothetical protein
MRDGEINAIEVIDKNAKAEEDCDRYPFAFVHHWQFDSIAASDVNFDCGPKGNVGWIGRSKAITIQSSFCDGRAKCKRFYP